jgi:hypothetical protein
MTMHATADIIWLVGMVMVTLALDFLSRRFGSGRLRRHPGRPGPASGGDRRGEIAKEPPASIQQMHQKEDVDV